MKELTTQGDYQLRLRDLQTDEKIKALTDAAAAQAAAAKARYEALDQVRGAVCLHWQGWGWGWGWGAFCILTRHLLRRISNRPHVEVYTAKTGGSVRWLQDLIVSVHGFTLQGCAHLCRFRDCNQACQWRLLYHRTSEGICRKARGWHVVYQRWGPRHHHKRRGSQVLGSG